MYTDSSLYHLHANLKYLEVLTKIRSISIVLSQGFFGNPNAVALRNETKALNPILSADITEAENGYKVTVDLPGVRESDLAVEVSEVDNTLTIRGHVESTKEEQTDLVHRRERHTGDVSRTIPLPDGANTHEATTLLKNGILTVSFPKLASSKKTARRLEINRDDGEESEKATKKSKGK